METARPELPYVCVLTELIAPGGGPPGYVYNLREGFALLDELDFDVHFVGRELGFRYNGTGGAVKGWRRAFYRLPRPLRESIKAIARFPRRVIGRVLSFERSWRREIQDSSYVVLQGYQPVRRLNFARSKGVKVGYMPHSPVPAGHQARDLGGNPRSVGQALDNEAALLTSADVIYFPCSEAVQPYREWLIAEEWLHEGNIGEWEEKLVFIESGVKAPTGQELRVVDNGCPLVLFVGRYINHKGYDLFVTACEELALSGVRARFATMGDGPDRRESDWVEDLGWQSAPESTILNAGIVVIPNRVAFFDLLPLEAASLGVGLVLTRLGGNKRQLEMLPDAFGCDIDSVAEGIQRGLDELQIRPNWGTANRVAYLEYFTERAFALRWQSEMLRQLS